LKEIKRSKDINYGARIVRPSKRKIRSILKD